MSRVADGAPTDGPLAGDGAIDQLLRRYAALIRNVVSRTAGRDSGVAHDDIEQQVIISLWKQLDREQSINYPASYIYRTAVRETIRAVRRARAREQPAGDALDLEPHLSTEVTPETRLEGKETAAALKAAMMRLQPERRQAVQAHLAGYDVTEIMRMFEWNYQKARNLISRGMADLRTMLIEKGIRG
jgi:RNA polymerase sigma factor (sigma-70 family)